MPKILLCPSRGMRPLLAAILPGLLAFVIPVKTSAAPAVQGVVEVMLNGLKITLDEQSGSIVGLDYPGPGKMLAALPGQGGIVDLAYPIPEFEPLRLATRYSGNAKFEQTPDSLVVTWDELGASRPYFRVRGKVSARVSFKAMPDGRSIALQCRIDNRSELPVRQVLFPDLPGLLPFAGKETTFLRSAGFVKQPFLDVGATDYPEFYAVERGDIKNTLRFTGGGKLGQGDTMVGRWLDFGGLNGGLSLFPKLWTGAPETEVRIYRLEKDPNVRLMHIHDVSVASGETWESPEYVLTPHAQGWAKGIEPYREFVNSKVSRQFPVPKHVREGLGFRTIWMCKGYPADGDRDVAFKFSELPKIAAEAKEHGLDEMVIWFWTEFFHLPMSDPYSHLGTPKELAEAIKECNRIGVNVSLFISFISLAEPAASRYGLRPKEGGWTYHSEMIPAFNPKYAKGRATAAANPNDPKWIEDVLANVKRIYDNYTHSVTWDQANPGTEKTFKIFLPWAKDIDPRATFSGEITGSAERCADFLDYTWNWESGSYSGNLQAPYRDVRAFTSAFRSPRLNLNINRNTWQIKYGFMDNNYVNAMPTAPDDANGSAWLRDFPEVSRVLKQCAGLRRQFLRYFTEGTLIGECLLKEMPAGAHVNAYVLADRVLFMVMNTQNQTRRVNFRIDLAPWLASGTGEYEVRSYDQDGKRLETKQMNAAGWTSATAELGAYDFALYEFIAR